MQDSREFGCLMLDFKILGWEKWSQIIDPSHLVKQLPADPHCTALYGFLSDVQYKDVAKYCPKLKSFRMQIKGIDAFYNETEEVLHYVLECPEIDLLHHRLKVNLPCELTHPVFKPHMTIAYLKPNTAKLYLKELPKKYIINPFQYRFSPATGVDICFT